MPKTQAGERQRLQQMELWNGYRGMKLGVLYLSPQTKTTSKWNRFELELATLKLLQENVSIPHMTHDFHDRT